jgi:hypothetical protein
MARRREAEVELGPHRYTVVPQKIGRLRRELNRAFNSETGDEEAEAVAEALDAAKSGEEEDVIEALGGQAHAVLLVFIPDLMPKYEWLGFASEEAMKADESSDATDHSPDMDQVIEALNTCMQVNRIDLLKHLRSLVGPDFLQAMVQKLIADFLTSNSPNSSSVPTLDTPTTTSTPTDQTLDQPGNEILSEDGYDLIRSSEPIGASAG